VPVLPEAVLNKRLARILRHYIMKPCHMPMHEDMGYVYLHWQYFYS